MPVDRFSRSRPFSRYEVPFQDAIRVPDAAAYSPVTILVDERADGVHLSFDSMASLLAPYGSQSALAVATTSDIALR
jgi:hypothetical protein